MFKPEEYYQIKEDASKLKNQQNKSKIEDNIIKLLKNLTDYTLDIVELDSANREYRELLHKIELTTKALDIIKQITVK
jgi:DNA-binding transcriptional regulator GbsR (MarR family)